MCPCKYPKRIRAASVAVAAGVTTITLPTTADINPGEVIDVLVAVPIPDGTNGSSVSVTNGTVTGNVLVCNGNYYRPRPILSRTVLRLQYLSDPAHFQLLAVRR